MAGNTKTKVALVKCNSYDRNEVEQAVAKAVDLLGGFDVILGERDGEPAIAQDGKIVLKPNLLARAVPEKAVTTHPEVFRAVGRLLKNAGYGNITYGDSPGNPMVSVSRTAEGCGIKQVADELGIVPGDFEHGVEIELPEGRAAKHFVLCREIAETVGAVKKGTTGGVINLCKMKTHQLERITGAVKNTFGCIHGVNKAASHAKFVSAEHFARMLADLNTLVRPRLHIMDGIVAMEGNGPGSGDPISMNVILASTDPVALDVAFCHLICLDDDLVPTNRAAADAGVGTRTDDEIEVVLGNMPMQPDGAAILLDDMSVKYGNRNFNVQRGKEYRGSFRIINLFGGLIEKKPVVIEEKCVGCGICVDTCPVEGKAISLVSRIRAALSDTLSNSEAGRALYDMRDSSEKKVAMYDYDKCIKCYCCQEMCPEKAISVKKSLLAKIIDRKWKI